jgi:hypothetical protein
MEPGPISPMHPTPAPDAPSRDPDWHACLLRTRSAVLNTLVGVGLSIAVSGWLLRGRAETWQPRPATVWKETLTGGLIVLGMASYLSLRIMCQRARRSQPDARLSRFFWSHLIPALIAAAILPLGFAYGWMVAPQLDAVIPFWVVPLALGFLSLPRQRELRDFHDPAHRAGASSP